MFDTFSFFRRPGNAPDAHRPPAGKLTARLRNAVLAVALAGLAAACASAPPPPPPVVVPPPPEPTAPEPETPIRPDRTEVPDFGVTPPHMEGRELVRVALLLPFTHSSSAVRTEAGSMLNAAELALFERGNESMLLIPKDTGGTRAGAEAATRNALQEGADVILGPLFAQAVSGAGSVARPRGIPVIAFSTDRSVAGTGVYLLSFAPEPEVRRAASFAASRGATSIALLAADNAFGRRVADVLREISQAGGPQFFEAAFYQANNFDQATAAIERLASARAAGAFDAIYISDSPGALRELSSVIRSNSLSAGDLMVLGPDSWRTDPQAGTVGVLDGAFMAGPDQSQHSAFAAAYRAAYSDSPSDLASLAYDAVAVAAQLRGDDADWGTLENRSGYLGADGLFRLPPDGVVERGLAVYELGPAGSFVVEPAPSRFNLGF